MYIYTLMELHERRLRGPELVWTLLADGTRTFSLNVTQVRGTRPPTLQTDFTLNAPW